MLGFLNVNKPSGMTSHDVVAHVRRLAAVQQVGHAGTLDPMARGVLPVGVGKACRLLRFLATDKTYIATILLGTRTVTDDIEGEIIEVSRRIPPAQAVRRALSSFTGSFLQRPPLYSAVHVKGRRLHEIARQGAEVPDLPERGVTVFSLEVLYMELPSVTVRIHCSRGTYIRSIARDLGDELGCGACLQSLIRTSAGNFLLEEALALDALREAAQAGRLSALLTRPDSVLPLPAMSLGKQDAQAFCHGKQIPANLKALSRAPESEERSGGADARSIMLCYNGSLIGIGTLGTGPKPLVKPEVVLRDTKQLG